MAEEIDFNGHPTRPYLVASYEVLNEHGYYEAFGTLLTSKVESGRRLLYVEEEHRVGIVPILELLFMRGRIIQLSIFFEDGLRVDVYNPTNWKSLFIRTVKLGLTTDQIEEIRTRHVEILKEYKPLTSTLKQLKLPYQYDEFLGANCNCTRPSISLGPIISDFLGYTDGRVDAIIAGYKKPDEDRLRILSTALAQLSCWIPAGLTTEIGSLRDRIDGDHNWAELAHDLYVLRS